MKIGRFDISSDKHQWILTESYEGKDKDGNPKMQSRESYFSTIEQCCIAIIQREAKMVDDVEGIVNAIYKASERIAEACANIKKEHLA